MGLHQGSVLSPFLFALLMNELTRSIQEKVPWCMLFVDIVLIDETRNGVNARWGSETDGEVRLATQIIPKKGSFKYLGSVIQGSGDINDDVTHRIGVVWRKWRLASESCV
ncbi:hypothetical protein H5410_065112, partial [Solanum commersonii]